MVQIHSPRLKISSPTAGPVVGLRSSGPGTSVRANGVPFCATPAPCDFITVASLRRPHAIGEVERTLLCRRGFPQEELVHASHLVGIAAVIPAHGSM